MAHIETISDLRFRGLVAMIDIDEATGNRPQDHQVLMIKQRGMIKGTESWTNEDLAYLVHAASMLGTVR